MKRLYINLLLLFFIYLGASAQDIHFSQFDAIPLYLNPALTGDFDGDLRLVANHKNQWASISTPYKTISVSLDANQAFNYVKKSVVGYGLWLTNDKAGDSNFGKTSVNGVFSFRQGFFRDTSLTVALGVVAGYNQHTIDYNRLSFDQQFNGYQYDPNSPKGMIPEANSHQFFDLSSGAEITYRLNRRILLRSGLALAHINKPQQSFSKISPTYLEPRFSFHGSAEIRTQYNLTFMPSYIYMRQGKYNETAFGGMIRFIMQNPVLQAFYFGSWYRFNDASILKVGVDIFNFNIGLSYDLNNSKLATASNGEGGLELSLIYIFKFHRIVVPNHKVCPTFM